MDQVFVEVSFEDGKVQFDQAFMTAMWQPSRLEPHPVGDVYAFEYQGRTYGIVDLLCCLDEVSQELREKGPEAIIEAVLELINQVYIGDESFTLIGRCADLYGIELNGRAGIVFRTVVMDTEKTVEEMLMLREVAQSLFPVPNPQ